MYEQYPDGILSAVLADGCYCFEAMAASSMVLLVV